MEEKDKTIKAPAGAFMIVEIGFKPSPLDDELDELPLLYPALGNIPCPTGQAMP